MRTEFISITNNQAMQRRRRRTRGATATALLLLLLVLPSSLVLARPAPPPPPEPPFAALLDPTFFFRGQSYANERAASPRRTDRVAIIGAGASGLAAAHFLRQRGYEKITLFEKNPRAGGKVDSVTEAGQIYELGAFWASDTYPTVLELAHAYGVAYEPDLSEFWVERSPAYAYQFSHSLLLDGRLLQLPATALAMKALILRFGAMIKRPGFDGIHPDLTLDFDTFSKKYGVGAMADAFLPFWRGCGYAPYEQTPAIFVLKLMTLGIASSLANTLKFMSLDAAQRGFYRFPGGYGTLFEAVAATFPDVRLASPVESIERVVVKGGAGKTVVVRIAAGGKTDEFDRLIVSADLRAAKKMLGGAASDEEKDLFDQVRSVSYNSHLFDIPGGTRHPPGHVVFFDQHTSAASAGHVVALANCYHANNTLWNVMQVVDPTVVSAEEAEKRLDADLDSLSGGDKTTRALVRKEAWNYFPHVSSEALRAGFYERMRALQGQNGTYYVGGIMNLETVEGTTAFAKDLVMRYF